MLNLQMFGTLVDGWLFISLGVGTKTGNFRKFQKFTHTDISLCITLGAPLHMPQASTHLLPAASLSHSFYKANSPQIHVNTVSP